MITVEATAKICHEANRAYCEGLGDMTQLPWDLAPTWQKESAIKGVEFTLENPTAGVDATHKSWYDQKLQNGWKYGPVKDADLKEHPCMVDFQDLPLSQQMKDVLFRSVVESLRPLIINTK